ncbi:MAG: hypothetical protein IT379_21305, partial [Deltaproteobacteria bacterium]|nr:hypothetical protein [Deltaproteobacteria bacterium]
MKKAACIALGIASMHIVAMAQQRTPSSRAPDGLQIPEEVCRSGTGCVVVSRQSAGTDAQGRALWVVMTAPRGTRPVDEESARTELGCVPYVYWALATEGDRTVDRRRILDVCNDGYGAAGVGEDEVVVGPNRFEH